MQQSQPFVHPSLRSIKSKDTLIRELQPLGLQTGCRNTKLHSVKTENIKIVILPALRLDSSCCFAGWGKKRRDPPQLGPPVKCGSRSGERRDVRRRSSELTRRSAVAVTSATSALRSQRAGSRWAAPLRHRWQHPWCHQDAPLNKWQRGRSIYRAGGGGGAGPRIVTSGSRRHITSCRQALTVGASGEIKEDSCVS